MFLKTGTRISNRNTYRTIKNCIVYSHILEKYALDTKSVLKPNFYVYTKSDTLTVANVYVIDVSMWEK